jgi:tyrosinase
VETFPTWHRPYVALYEQLIASYFPAIINTYNSQNPTIGAQLEESSKLWRLPYWDWADDYQIPQELSVDTIKILLTDGSVGSVPNPLHHYTFNPVSDLGIDDSGSPFAYWPTTLRSPRSTNVNATSDPQVANARLSNGDFKQWVLDLFTAEPNEENPWDRFSNHNWDDSGRGNMTSLESIHDTVHGDVGGNGHMGDPDVAAFDPIFWLHHCQVDRILALWQAVYYNIYVSPGPDSAGIHFSITVVY